MPKVHWLDVPHTSSYRTVIGVIPPREGRDTLYSTELKSNLYLIARACSRLYLKERYALQAVRSSQLEVRMVFERAEDAETVGAIVGLVPPLPVTSSFLLDDQNASRLLAIGGPPDHKGADRRARERAARWGNGGFLW